MSAFRAGEAATAIDASAPVLAIPARRERLPAWGAAVTVVLFFALLGLPLAGSLGHWRIVHAQNEKRILAKPPPWPRGAADLLAVPGELNRFANDRFGFRPELVWLDGWLRFHLFGEVASDQVLFGRHGRLFLISHLRGQPFSLIDNVCGIGTTPAHVRQAAARVAWQLAEARSLAPRAAFIAIPTAPVLYPEDLPRWLAARCRAGRPSAPETIAAFDAGWPALRGGIIYPLAAIRAAKTAGPAIPTADFHWDPFAAKRVVEAVAEHTLGMAKQHEIGLRPVTAPSDLSNFIPGLAPKTAATAPVFASSGIGGCTGVRCLPELTAYAPVLNDASHFWWRGGRGPTLLLLSDSFGAAAAPFFAEYFARVIHLNVSYDRMDPELRRKFPKMLHDLFKPDVILLLFHDAALG